MEKYLEIKKIEDATESGTVITQEQMLKELVPLIGGGTFPDPLITKGPKALNKTQWAQKRKRVKATKRSRKINRGK